jgi:hypothetical protein
VTQRRQGVTEDEQALGDARGPVTGSGRRRDRVGGMRRGVGGRAAAVAARREAVLRVLMEAYRRDVGPGAFDPR